MTKDFEDISFIGSYLNPSMVASITASCISLVVIIILNIIYNWAALVLTEFEVRSQENLSQTWLFRAKFPDKIILNVESFLVHNSNLMIHTLSKSFAFNSSITILPCSILRFSKIHSLELLVGSVLPLSVDASAFIKQKYHFSDNYNYIEAGERRFRWQGCPEGGCSYELAIQLMITMVGKQIFNNCVEFLFPWLMRKVSKCRKVTYHKFTRKNYILSI